MERQCEISTTDNRNHRGTNTISLWPVAMKVINVDAHSKPVWDCSAWREVTFQQETLHINYEMRMQIVFEQCFYNIFTICSHIMNSYQAGARSKLLKNEKMAINSVLVSNIEWKCFETQDTRFYRPLPSKTKHEINYLELEHNLRCSICIIEPWIATFTRAKREQKLH